MTPELIEDLGMMLPNDTSKQKRKYGIYKCPYCGNKFKAITDNVNKGNTTSCGCYHKQVTTKHGLTKHPLRNVYKSIPNDKGYKNYGGRGISVGDAWSTFEEFYGWAMSNGYAAGLSIDRIDASGNYTPDNCRWATRTVQNRNTRRLSITNTSGYRGVHFHKASGKWQAYISVDNKRKHLGLFLTALDAAKAYDSYVIENNLEHTTNDVLKCTGGME